MIGFKDSTMQKFQQTLSRPIQLEGIGLHSGKSVRMTLFPAPPHSGIHLISHHRGEEVRIKASVHHITKTTLSTTLGFSNAAEIHTVEHILSALYGLEIDNVTIQLDDIEIPIMDGSALPFVNSILSGGIERQNRKKRVLTILKKIELEEEGKTISVLPSRELRIDYSIDFEHPLVGRQDFHFTLTRQGFVRRIAPARTFGFTREFDELQKQGLIKGGSLDNAVVVGDDRILNREGLRFKDEFVRHKILDLIGDLSLLGYPVRGHFVAHRAGHALHARFVAKILEESECWELSGDDRHENDPVETPRSSGILLVSR